MFSMRSENLQRVLRANAAFSATCAIGLIGLRGALFPILGLGGPEQLLSTGVSLVIFAGTLLWAASRSPVPLIPLTIFVILDILWVVFTVGVMASIGSRMTPLGQALTVGVGVVVGVFGMLQLKGALWLRRGGSG